MVNQLKIFLTYNMLLFDFSLVLIVGIRNLTHQNSFKLTYITEAESISKVILILKGF